MSTSNVETTFLGWDRMPMDLATEWLLENIGADMSKTVVALPGARSGRLLEDALARALGKELRPPRIVTAGSLSDALLELKGTSAGRLARTLAWAKALRSLAPAQIGRIIARAPQADDATAWWRLAEEVRALFGELAAEELDFARVASNELLLAQNGSQEGERARWLALAQAQQAMLKELESAGLADPHQRRSQAIADGNKAPVERVVLIGVAETNQLLRRALDVTDAQCTALIFAPSNLAHMFDSLGCLVAAEWCQRDVSLDLDQWKVAERPADQAHVLHTTLVNWNAEFSAEEITVGLGNPEVGPFVKRRLSEEAIHVRDAAGSSPANSHPAKLLSLVASFLESSRFTDLANLLRHVDFERAVLDVQERQGTGAIDPIATVDAYFNAHYPDQVEDVWLANPRDKRDVQLQSSMQTVWEACAHCLGGLWQSPSLTITEAVARLRVFLENIYENREFDLTAEADRDSFGTLETIGKGFSELEALPSEIAPKCTMAQVLQLLQRTLQSGYLPPPASPEGQPTIEMLGWLELPLDNAPALVVVGFEDGHVPESVRGDAYLPNQLRSSLGLLDDQKRLARDLYASELLVHSRKRLCFISGRRNQLGDPLLPSRIVFHCQPDQLIPRVQRFLAGTPTPTLSVSSSVSRAELPGNADDFELQSISVTDFRTFLNSPYDYFLRKVRKLKSLDDRARELDGLAFGNLAHTVLERFGDEPKVRNKVEAKPIANYLRGQLRDLAKELFGPRPLPAIRLQIEQLELRLVGFAAKQAERRYGGWEIHQTEWNPEGGGIPFVVDGKPVELRGRIDRIDYHPTTKRWAIWDYKAGNNIRKPQATHLRGDGRWRDLQLPLYCLLAEQLLGDQPPFELGYAAIPQDISAIGFDSLVGSNGKVKQFDCLEDAIGSAYEEAQEVVRSIRKGEFFQRDGFNPSQGDPVFRAIGGLGVIEDNEDDQEDDQ